jgi:hypothetical protein
MNGGDDASPFFCGEGFHRMCDDCVALFDESDGDVAVARLGWDGEGACQVGEPAG